MPSLSQTASTALQRQLQERLSPDSFTWLNQRKKEEISAALLQIPRKLGRRSLIAAFAERRRSQIQGVYGPIPIGALRVDEAGRIFLLIKLLQSDEAPYARLFQLYNGGDTETRAACLRALNYLEDPDRESGLKMVLDAGRTYLNELLTAAWCHNPFSSHCLNEHDYRKAVLKALFLEIPVEEFIGLEERVDPKLAQSLCEYADERLAAGRSIPAPVWIVSALHPRPGLIARLIGMLEHPLPKERNIAAQALKNARDPRALPFILERLEREAEPEIHAALREAQSATEAAQKEE